MQRGRRSSTNRGQLGPLGVMLILAIVVIGMVSIVVVGGQAITDSRRHSELDRAQTTLQQFDSRASLVALGDTDLQSLSLGTTGDGQWEVDEDAGYVTIIHNNYMNESGGIVNGSSQVIANSSLGGLVYRTGDASVAYQAGGIWRSDDGVSSVMVSPPEFHYHEETLVFPIVNITGDDSVGGTTRATMTGTDSRTKFFPDPGNVYAGTNRSFGNPIRGGTVTVLVRSDYYQAWGRFFEERMGGDISFDADNKTVQVVLDAPQFIGEFEMPREEESIKIQGITGGHALRTFTIDLVPDNTDAARFNNLQWSLHIKEGSKELETHLRLRNAADNSSTPCKEQSIAATLYYSADNGNTYHGWKNPDAFRTTCIDGDDEDTEEDQVHLAVNLTGPTQLSMTDLESDDLLYYSANTGDQLTEITFDEHASVVDWEPVTYNSTNDHETIGNLLKHYFGMFGQDYDIVVTDKVSDTVNEDNSTGFLDYGSKGKVTYLHVSEEELNVTLRK